MVRLIMVVKMALSSRRLLLQWLGKLRFDCTLLPEQFKPERAFVSLLERAT